jgi:hypothetical protein
MMKFAGLSCLVLSLLISADAAQGQGFIARASTSRTVWVEFAGGGPNRNGYETARAPVEYQVYACRGVTPGSVLVRFGLKPDNAAASSAYWYEGQRYEATARPVVRAALLDATATSPAGEVGSMRREATPASSMPSDCENGGVNFADLGLLSRFADPTKPAAVAQFLNTVTLSAEAMSEPLRDSNLEREFARQRRMAEKDAADQARAEQQARDRQAAQTPVATQPGTAQTQVPAGSAATDSAATRPTPEQTAAAQQAVREEEARRAVEQVQEDARREQEQQEDLTEAAVEVATMAALSGGAVGGYYFTGGDATNSFNKFSELTGMGIGFNFGPMIMDIGQLKGTYNEFFVEDYADENGGLLPESGEVDGMFLHVGLQLQKTFESFRFGVSGGYLYGTTTDAEISSPTIGFLMGYSMLKFRYDVGLGDEGTAGYALYLQF